MPASNPVIVFMGSPEFAVPVLRALTQHFEVVGVITQPDRPAGRGRILSPPPVKQLAMELGLPSIQPKRLRDPEAVEQLKTWAPDLIVVAAFGQILRKEVLDLPAFGCVNVHASLLPRWRGAAPIQAAILHGDHQTGVTIMRMDAGIDTGPVIHQRATPIHPDETAGELSERLAVLGAELLINTLPAYLNGELLAHPQDETRATYAPPLKKEDGLLDFNRPAEELARQVRAFQPWPGAYTYWLDRILKVRSAYPILDSEAESQLSPGQRTVYENRPAICTSHGLLILEELQPAGKKAMAGEVFLQGARNWL
jgi:methionyl-tRNA formyltransferase